MNPDKPACKAILVDFDGVIRHWPKDVAGIEHRFHLPVGAIGKEAFSDHQLEPAIRGSISDSQWRDRVSAALQRQYPDCGARAAINAWGAQTGVISRSVLAILEQRNSPNGIVLFTNATSRLDSDLASHGLLNRFRAIVNSSETGSMKPELEMFHHAIRACDCRASEIAYVDDDAMNVATGVSLGLNAHRYTGKASLIKFLIDGETRAVPAALTDEST